MSGAQKSGSLELVGHHLLHPLILRLLVLCAPAVLKPRALQDAPAPADPKDLIPRTFYVMYIFLVANSTKYLRQIKNALDNFCFRKCRCFFRLISYQTEKSRIMR